MRPSALVTGAGKRVGRAIAVELARSGFDLALHVHHSQGEGEVVAGLCAELGAEVSLFQADLSDDAAVLRLGAEVSARFPALDVLVNNASVFEPVAFEEIDLGAWERMLAVNLRAPFRLAQALLPALRAPGAVPGSPEGQHGVVVQLCDIGADRPVSGYAHYSVSKAGLVMLVKAMAVELAPLIRTVGVSPGQVAWSEDYSEALREKIRRRIPLHRVGEPDDIARLVRFLVLEAHYLNGNVVAVDGGLSQRY